MNAIQRFTEEQSVSVLPPPLGSTVAGCVCMHLCVYMGVAYVLGKWNDRGVWGVTVTTQSFARNLGFGCAPPKSHNRI